MSVYVDRVRTHEVVRGEAARYGKRWSHLIADTEEELHDFARRLGLKRAWAQYPGTPRAHYDIIPSKRAIAVRLGAIEVDDRTFVTIRTNQPRAPFGEDTTTK